MNEGPLHAALKAEYQRPGDRAEVPLLGGQIDVVRDDLLIEIQTRGLGALRGKLERLLEAGYAVLVVHPLPVEKWIVRVDEDGHQLGRRRSPTRGSLPEVFEELVGLSRLLAHPRLSLEVVLTREEEVRRHDGRSWRRKGWGVVERRLVEIVTRVRIDDARDLIGLLPADLPEPFDTAELAHHMGVSRALAQKVAYCLREAGVIFHEGKRGNAHVYGIPP